MRTDGVLNILGKLLLLISLFILLPIPVSLIYHDGMTRAFLTSALIGGLMGGFLIALFPPNPELGYRDGFAVATFSWLGLAFLGALPFFFSGSFPSFIDCYFESMSGFTTTGSTILSNMEILPRSMLFWRALTHWIGGMGIIVLSLAVLPLLGIGGMQLFQAEMPGPTKDRLAPRMQNTARILWGVYVLITFIEIILLLLGGMDLFDATCHAFASLATGGFSTYTASVSEFNSPYIEAVIIFFMFAAGTNFTLHYHALHGRWRVYWQSEEFRFYLTLVAVSSLIIVFANQGRIYQSWLTNIRDSIFQVVSIITTTGFGTADFDKWPALSKILLVALMFIGGCAGSTGGGIKVVRLLLFLKYARLQLRKLVHPNEVNTIKMGNIKVPQEVMLGVLGFLAIYIVFCALACVAVTAQGVDMVTGVTAVIATLNNIGPGLNAVGPVQNFGALPATAKVILIICMLAGRLELYTVVVLLTPDFWKMARRPKFRKFKRLSLSR